MPEERLRVAIVAACLGYKGGFIGGAERQAFYMARALAEAGVEVRIFSLAGGGAYEDALRRMRVEAKQFGWLPGVPVRLMLLLAGMRRFRPHVVQSVHTYTNVYSALAARILGAVSIGGLRSDLSACFTDNGRFSRFLFTWPDGVVANSRTAIDQVTQAGLLDPSRLHFLANVIELETFADPPAGDGRDDNVECVCICVTRLFPFKRVDVFLRALATARTIEPRLRGIVVGFGPEAARLRQLAAELGLHPGALRFLGPREDIAALLQQAAIFVFCSESEGSPNVILEAMAARLPVITTPAGDAADIVESAGAGYVVPFGNVDTVSAAMVQLARSPELRAKFGKAGRDYVARHRAPAELAGRLLRIYADVARTSGRRRNHLLERVAQCAARL